MVEQVVMMTAEQDMVRVAPRSTDSGGTDDEAEPTPKDREDLIAVLCWNMHYNYHTRTCCNGTDWCNEEALLAPVDPEDNLYNRTVLGVTRTMVRLNVAIATFFLRLGRGFRVKVRVGRVVVGGKEMLSAVAPCKK